jgi:hypothetical protein
VRGVPGDGPTLEPESLRRLVSDPGHLGHREGEWALFNHVEPEGRDAGMLLAEGLVFEEGLGAHRAGRGVLEQEQALGGEHLEEVGVGGELGGGHTGWILPGGEVHTEEHQNLLRRVEFRLRNNRLRWMLVYLKMILRVEREHEEAVDDK